MGKSFSFEIFRSLAKILGVGFLFFCVSFAVGFTLSRTMYPDSQVMAANVVLDQPIYNWYVCEDLGMGTIPGVPDQRQILRLCHNQGWQIRAYCMQPSMPAPPIGVSCSHTPEGPYWCGDSYQLLQEYILDVTPTATQIPTETNTPIPEETRLPSATASLTPSATEIYTDTPPPTFTPRVTYASTLTPASTNTPVPSLTGTIITTQTPLVSQTDVPISSLTPTVFLSQTPLASITHTPVMATETSHPTLTVTPTPAPTERSETPVASATPLPGTPISTPRPRPGGDGNLGRVSLLVVTFGALLFAIGFLSFLLLYQSRFAARASNHPQNNLPLGNQKPILRNHWLVLIILISLISLAGFLISVWVPQFIVGQPQPMAVSMISPLSFDNSLTATPFQPRHPTPVYSPELEPENPPTFDFQQINFEPQLDWFQLSIDPPSPQVNQGKPINLSFIPAEACNFGDHQACISTHTMDQQNLIFLTIHSGFGGEGQAFRHAVEGTGINKASFSQAKVAANLSALQAAQVSITTNGDESGGFEVRGVIRVPAIQVDAYFDLPIEAALKMAISLNPDVWSGIDKNLPLLIFETCGWKIPNEPGAEGVSDTTGSVYIVIIQPTR